MKYKKYVENTISKLLFRITYHILYLVLYEKRWACLQSL